MQQITPPVVTIRVVFYQERKITLPLPISAIESGTIANGQITEIDQISDDFFDDFCQGNSIDRDTVESFEWEIKP